MKPSPNCSDRRPRALEDLPDDRRDHEQREDRRGGGHAVERPSPIRSRRRRVRRRRRLRRRPRRLPSRDFQGARPSARGVTTSSHDVHILCTPRRTPRKTLGHERRGASTARNALRSAPASGVTGAPPRSEARTVFDIDDLSVLYGEALAVKRRLARDLPNAITALIGPSGCGKSTFLRCLNRMNDLVPSARVEGKLLYHGTDLYGAGVDPIEVRRRIGMVFQRPNPFPKSIYDNIAYGLRILGMKDNLDDRVEQALRRAAIWDEVKNRLKRPRWASRAASSSGSASPGRSRSSRTSCSSTSPPRRSTRSRPRRSRT